MRITVTKEHLTKEFFAIKGNYQTVKVERLIDTIEKYLAKNKADIDLQNMLLILQVEQEYFKTNDFDKCMATATPIFEYLEGKNSWTYFDITVLSYIIRFSKTFTQAMAFAEKALNLLDTEFNHEEDYWGMRFAIQSNVIPRIVDAKYAIDIQGQHEAPPAEVDKALNLYLPYVLKICEDYNFQAYKLMTLVRKGIYDGDYQETERNLYLMRKLPTGEERALYNTTVGEIMRYHHLMGSDFSDQQLNLVQGYHIRRAREAINMTRQALANLLHISDRYLGQIERGEGGLSGILLYRAADFLGVNSNYLNYGSHERPVLGSKANSDVRKNAMSLLMDELTDDEQDIAIAQVQVVVDHKAKNKKQEENDDE